VNILVELSQGWTRCSNCSSGCLWCHYSRH